MFQAYVVLSLDNVPRTTGILVNGTDSLCPYKIKLSVELHPLKIELQVEYRTNYFKDDSYRVSIWSLVHDVYVHALLNTDGRSLA